MEACVSKYRDDFELIFSENELKNIAERFRSAIEKTDLSESSIGKQAFLNMRDFPHCACDEACTLLGIYLVEKYKVHPLVQKGSQIEEGNKWFGTHYWLEHNDIIIDISADQFEMVNNPVIVSRYSYFHTHYAKKIAIITENFKLDNQLSSMKKLYSKVINTFERLYF